MSHSHGGGAGGSMADMSVGSEVPSQFYLQQMYWAVVGTAIGIAALVNIANEVILRQRLAGRNGSSPARPTNLFDQGFATLTAVFREVSNATVLIFVPKWCRISSPTLGQVCLVLAELVLVTVLCFYRLDPADQWQWEDIGYRTGFVSAAQLPLIVLLAGKKNIIGALIGSSYERLNWLHRWVSRILFLTVTIHMGFWFTNWDRYDYIMAKMKSDVITRRGFAAWCILLWIILSSLAPIRRWNYEFFVIQHIVTFIGFFAAVFLHLPSEMKVYIWLPIALYVFDRIVRTGCVLFTNMNLFRPKAKGEGFWTCLATLEPLSGDTARLSINNPPLSWRPGQHVFLSCHGIAPFQSHPFTIASIPEDNRMEFLIKCKTGATKRFLSHANKCQSLPLTNKNLRAPETFKAIIDGPYGRMRLLRQFDSVFLIGGSSGGSFTVPLMRDIVASWKKASNSQRRRIGFLRTPDGAITRYVRFIWVVKTKAQYSWFASHLSQVIEDVAQLRQEGHDVAVDISIYITCDNNLESENPASLSKSQENRLSDDIPEAIALPDLASPILEPAKIRDIAMTSVKPPSEYIRKKKTCVPNGTCCCATTIEDEDTVRNPEIQQCCCCNAASSSEPYSMRQNPKVKEAEAGYRHSSGSDTSTSETSSSPLEVNKQLPPTFHSSIAVLTGRPNAKNLIRKTLEEALGESAVVACGPQGLTEDVRSTVVSLSDERAVHKGTGAQGIYFWGEGFEY